MKLLNIQYDDELHVTIETKFKKEEGISVYITKDENDDAPDISFYFTDESMNHLGTIHFGPTSSFTDIYEIWDNYVFEKGCGYGKAFMNIALNYIKDHCKNINGVMGKLVEKDLKDTLYLPDYYKDLGFTVSLNEDKTSGSVRKML